MRHDRSPDKNEPQGARFQNIGKNELKGILKYISRGQVVVRKPGRLPDHYEVVVDMGGARYRVIYDGQNAVLISVLRKMSLGPR